MGRAAWRVPGGGAPFGRGDTGLGRQTADVPAIPGFSPRVDLELLLAQARRAAACCLAGVPS